MHLKLHYKAEKDPSNIVKIACDLEQTFVDSKVESTVNTVAINDPEMAFPRNEEGPCSTTISESCLSALEDRIVAKVIAALSTSDDQKSRQGQRGDGQRDGTEKGHFKGRGVSFAKVVTFEENVRIKMHAKDAGRKATQPDTVQLPNQFPVL